MNSYDGGIWRRLRIIEFKSKFVDQPKASHEYKKDDNLSEKLDLWKEDFISYLIEYYKLYLKEGLKEPKEIMDNLNDYRKKQNKFEIFYEEYFKELIVEDIENKKGAKWSDIFNEYKKWHIEYYPSDRIDKNIKVREYFEKEVFNKEISVFKIDGRPIRGWKGYAISDKNSNENNSEEE